MESTNKEDIHSAIRGKDDLKRKNISDTAKFHFFLWLSIALLVVAFVASLSVGRYSIPYEETARILLSNIIPLEQTWTELQEAVVMTLRLPRAVAAIIIGAALGLSGATYQSIFKNPMASPDLLGVSSGACVGAAIAILLSLGSTIIQIFAFAGSLLAVGITITIPRLIRSESTTMLILSGIVVGTLMASILNFIKFVADPESTLAEITYWTMGSVSTVTFEQMLPVLPPIFICIIIILLMRFRLNALSLGDNEAKALGINIRNTRGIFILCSTLITASSVCIAGTIGWVGLIIPHAARILIGPDNKKMLPITIVFGGIFLLVIDVLCRTLTAADLRLGILTGIIGAPVFLLILVNQKRKIE